MTQGYGSAVDIDARPIPVQFFAVGQGLRGKSLVHLDQVKVADPEAGAL